MANVPETPNWESGIYQWEDDDPIEGGAGGLDNRPTGQLANRTSYLKSQIESFQSRVNGMALPYGDVQIQNKYVYSGFVLRYQYGDDGSFQVGIDPTNENLAYIDNQFIRFESDQYVTAPQDDENCIRSTLYLIQVSGSYVLQITPANGTVPFGGMPLYYINTDELGDEIGGISPGAAQMVSELDLRINGDFNTWNLNQPEIYVALPDGAVSDINYAIHTEPIYCPAVGFVGQIIVQDQTINGFKISITGPADNLIIRWALLRPVFSN